MRAGQTRRRSLLLVIFIHFGVELIDSPVLIQGVDNACPLPGTELHELYCTQLFAGCVSRPDFSL